jgi:hypothetical protein
MTSTANPAKAARDPEEEGEFMAFEQLMAEAQMKKDKDHKKKKEKDAATKKKWEPTAPDFQPAEFNASWEREKR